VADPTRVEHAEGLPEYLRRNSLFEALDRLVEARQQALRLRATGDGVPFPSFGLISMLDFPPFRAPDELASTYALPTQRADVLRAANTVADLLDEAAHRAARTIGAPLSTPWADTARRRLASVSPA